MKRVVPRRPPQPRTPERSGVARLGPVAAVLAIVSIVAWSWRERAAREQPLGVSIADAGLPTAPAPQPRLLDPPIQPLVEPQPWAATSENAPTVPSGQVPAWQVRPPAPDPNAYRPTDPTPPPDPMTARPPMDNPNGVDGERPERPGVGSN